MMRSRPRDTGSTGSNSMSRNVQVTVLLPVFNGAATVDAAVQSILCQTFSDFELLVVDDGSTDETPQRLAAHSDERVRVLRTPNRGVGAALKLGVEQARGEFIARMDADDISAPNRLEREVAALQEHPEVGVVHARVHFMDRHGRPLEERREEARLSDPGDGPVLHRWRLLWRNVVTHSTVMLRRSVLTAHGLNYREGVVCEDYDLWSRLLFVTDFMRLEESLLWYRVHPGSVSAHFDERHVSSLQATRIETLGRILNEPVGEAFGRDLAMLSGQTVLRPEEYEANTSCHALANLMRRVLKRFVEHFEVGAEHLPDLHHDAALQLLDWLWLLDRCPVPPPDGRMVLVRTALALSPWALLSRKLVRHFVGAAIGPAGLKRLREARHAWAGDRSGGEGASGS